MENFHINDNVQVIDSETERWTTAVIISLECDTVRVRFPGWRRGWSSGVVAFGNIRRPVYVEQGKRLRKRRLSPWEEATATADLAKMEKGDKVFYKDGGSYSPCQVDVVDPFRKEVVVVLDDGSRKTADPELLFNEIPAAFIEQRVEKKRTRTPSVQSAARPAAMKANKATPQPEAEPALVPQPTTEFDIFFVIGRSGLVIRCGEAYESSTCLLVVTRVIYSSQTDSVAVRGRRLGKDGRISAERVEITPNDLINQKSVKLDSMKTIKSEAIRRTQESSHVLSRQHMQIQRKSELGLLLKSQVRSALTAKGRSGSFTTPFQAAFDGALLHLDPAFGYKTEFCHSDLHLLDCLAGVGWDFKLVNKSAEAPGFFYFVKSVTVAVDFSSLQLRFSISYTTSQFNWNQNYRVECGKQLDTTG